MAITQREINSRIAIELDKHYVQNEYGYLLLDQDKSIRDKYKWFINLHTANWVSLSVSIVSAIIGLVSKLNWLLYIAAVLFGFFIIFIIVRYIHRTEISKLLNDAQRREIAQALEKHSEYVDNLRLWFMEVGADKNTDKKCCTKFPRNSKSLFSMEINLTMSFHPCSVKCKMNCTTRHVTRPLPNSPHY